MRKPSNVYFSPGTEDRRAVASVLGFIGKTRADLDVAVYSITHPTIATALVDAHNRGVRVRVLTDKVQAASRYALDELMEAAGIEVRRDREGGSMHLKMAISDGIAVGFGSFNWTRNAERRNREIWAVIRDSASVNRCAREFAEAWEANAP